MYGNNQYGVLKYGENIPGSHDIEKLTPDLMRYLPRYYKKSFTMINIQESIAQEFGVVKYHIEDIHKQFFLDTATWGLAIYEKELGLDTNMDLSYEDRREIIKAKLRGTGTVTSEMIKNTAEAFSGGEVDILEFPEEFYFIVKFIGIKGIPRNMQGFINMLEDIKPAHLGYEFKYNFTVWKMLKEWGILWGQVYTYWRDLIKFNWLELKNVKWNELPNYITPTRQERKRWDEFSTELWSTLFTGDWDSILSFKWTDMIDKAWNSISTGAWNDMAIKTVEEHTMTWDELKVYEDLRRTS